MEQKITAIRRNRRQEKKVTIRFRTGKNNVDIVWLCTDCEHYKMKKTEKFKKVLPKQVRCANNKATTDGNVLSNENPAGSKKNFPNLFKVFCRFCKATSKQKRTYF